MEIYILNIIRVLVIVLLLFVIRKGLEVYFLIWSDKNGKVSLKIYGWRNILPFMLLPVCVLFVSIILASFFIWIKI